MIILRSATLFTIEHNHKLGLTGGKELKTRLN